MIDEGDMPWNNDTEYKKHEEWYKLKALYLIDRGYIQHYPTLEGLAYKIYLKEIDNESIDTE